MYFLFHVTYLLSPPAFEERGRGWVGNGMNPRLKGVWETKVSHKTKCTLRRIRHESLAIICKKPADCRNHATRAGFGAARGPGSSFAGPITTSRQVSLHPQYRMLSGVCPGMLNNPCVGVMLLC